MNRRNETSKFNKRKNNTKKSLFQNETGFFSDLDGTEFEPFVGRFKDFK